LCHQISAVVLFLSSASKISAEEELKVIQEADEKKIKKKKAQKAAKHKSST
jgi:hypothetical protein